MVERRVLDSNLEKEYRKMIKKIKLSELQKYVYAIKFQMPTDYEEFIDIVNDIIKTYGNKQNVSSLTNTLSNQVKKALYERFNISNDPAAQTEFDNFIIPLIDISINTDTIQAKCGPNLNYYFEELDAKGKKNKVLEEFFPNPADEVISNGVRIYENIIRSNEFSVELYYELYNNINNRTPNEIISIIKDLLKRTLIIYSKNITNTELKNDILTETTNNTKLERIAQNIVNVLEENSYIDFYKVALFNSSVLSTTSTTPYIIRRESQKKYERAIANYYKSVLNGSNANIAETMINREQVEKELMEHLVHNITYMSASDKPQIIHFAKQQVFTQKNVILPETLMSEILSRLTAPEDNLNILKKGMSNYYMFLFNNEITFYDRNNKKYKLSLDDLHIIGLESNINDIFRYLSNKKSALSSTPITNLQNFIKIDSVGIPTIKKIDDRFDSTIEEFIKTEGRYHSKDNDVTIDKFEKRSRNLINVQSIISSIMCDDSEEHKIELLVYFFNVKKRLEQRDKKFRITFDALEMEKIIEENISYFGNDFLVQFKTKRKAEILKKVFEINNSKSKVDKILDKYDSIEKLQKYLNYKHQQFARYYIYKTNLSNPNNFDAWKRFFEDSTPSNISYDSSVDPPVFKDAQNGGGICFKIQNRTSKGCKILDGNNVIVCEIKFKSDGKIVTKNINPNYIIDYTSNREISIKNITRMDECFLLEVTSTSQRIRKVKKGFSKFSLANMYINEAIALNQDEFNDVYDNGNIKSYVSYATIANLFKIFDKVLYLNNFNYVIDIENIFTTDLQVANSQDLNGTEKCVLCEMNALRESIYALFNKIDSDNIAHFISIQNATEKNIINTSYSAIPELMDFNGIEYKTILSFYFDQQQKFQKNVMTQKHSEFQAKEFSLEEIVNDLLNGNTILRFATSSGKKRKYNSTTLSPNEIESAFDEKVNILDLVERNIIGICNVYGWLNNITSDELVEFANAKIVVNYWGYTPLQMSGKTYQCHCIKYSIYYNMQKNLKKLCEMLQTYLKIPNIANYEKNRALGLMQKITNYTGIIYNPITDTFDESCSQETILKMMIESSDSEIEKKIISMSDTEFLNFVNLIATKFPISCLVNLISLENSQNKDNIRINTLLNVIHERTLNVQDTKDKNLTQCFSPKEKERKELEVINKTLLSYQKFNYELDKMHNKKEVCEEEFLKYKTKIYVEQAKYYSTKLQILNDKKNSLVQQIKKSGKCYVYNEQEIKNKIKSLEKQISIAAEKQYENQYMARYLICSKTIILKDEKNITPNEIAELTKYSYYADNMEPIIFSMLMRKLKGVNKKDLLSSISKFNGMITCNSQIRSILGKILKDLYKIDDSLNQLTNFLNSPVNYTRKTYQDYFETITSLNSKIEKSIKKGYDSILNVMQSSLIQESDKEFVFEYLEHIERLLEFRYSNYTQVKMKPLIEYELDQILNSPQAKEIDRRINESLYILSGNVASTTKVEALQSMNNSTKNIVVKLDEIFIYVKKSMQEKTIYSEEDKTKAIKTGLALINEKYRLPHIIIETILSTLRGSILRTYGKKIVMPISESEKNQMIFIKKKYKELLTSYISNYNSLIEELSKDGTIHLSKLTQEKIDPMLSYVNEYIDKIDTVQLSKPVIPNLQSGTIKHS